MSLHPPPPPYPFPGYGFYGDCTCRYGSPVSALQRATATTKCPVPTGEITSAEGWSAAAHNFVQTLKPTGTSFAGRTITESDSSPGVDTCWFVGSAVKRATGVTGGTWRVGSDNRWGPDQVGWPDVRAIKYYRDEGEAPCGFTLYQRLTISGCGAGSSSTVYRKTVRLTGRITATTVSISRSRISRSKTLVIE